MDSPALNFFEHEARALLGRLAAIPSFLTSQVMVQAANVSPAALVAIETRLTVARRCLRRQLLEFIDGLLGGGWSHEPPERVQRRFTLLRLRFGAVVAQFDLFDDVLAQRSARDHGLWLAGLDALAADALRLPGGAATPPVVCYLDRGAGAAIRRARTRLPGGAANPVAIIRMPRERLVGGGMASSLVHEVGHQAAALLGLVESLREALSPLAASEKATSGGARGALGVDPVGPWQLWLRWISEIVADLWSVARVGVGATLGLMGVVSLPRAFVFRIAADDPHPFPWIRVMLSAALGQALYPHPQWPALQRLWRELYPPHALAPGAQAQLDALCSTLPRFVTLLLAHRPPSLRGQPLGATLAAPDRSPARLAALLPGDRRSADDIGRLKRLHPCLAMAALGQARMDGRLTATADARLVQQLLHHWAWQAALRQLMPPTIESIPNFS
jgi:hypothetical protein